MQRAQTSLSQKYLTLVARFLANTLDCGVQLFCSKTIPSVYLFLLSGLCRSVTNSHPGHIIWPCPKSKLPSWEASLWQIVTESLYCFHIKSNLDYFSTTIRPCGASFMAKDNRGYN